jgi:hypothetical protein
VLFIEYDRTQRVDKNYEKFRRYDAFPRWWSMHTGDGELPFVIFICQDDDQRDRFLAAADHELTGHLWHPSRRADPTIQARSAPPRSVPSSTSTTTAGPTAGSTAEPAVKLSGLMNVAGANT